MDNRQRSTHNDDNFDRVFIGRSGCMSIIIIIAIIVILYAISFQK
jgi:hypothetical protein